MKKLLSIISALTIAGAPVLADPKIDEWNTYHAMGCMLVQDCTEDIQQITSIRDVEKIFPEVDYTMIAPEFEALIEQLSRIGVGVYVADNKYFPRLHRGVYHTTGNNFFLNKKYMWDSNALLEVTRHEGWHTVQDCMAGELENNSIAILWNDGVVPNGFRIRADIAYGGNPQVVPWEAEAFWAGDEAYQTVNALKACKNPNVDMWDIYPPTPMTGEWLIKNGYWDGVSK